MKTLIAVPCMDQVAAPFAQSLAMLNKVGDCAIAMELSSLVYTSRNNLVKRAITMEADALLFLDSDMIFPADTLERMLKHLEAGREIVSGLYFKRRAPFSPVLHEELSYDWETQMPHYKDLKKLPAGKDPFEVEGCGMGCCMISKGVLLDVMLNFRTWFTPLEGVGEDLAFILRARELGYKVWCDPTISCGHVGQLIINEDIWRVQNAQEG